MPAPFSTAVGNVGDRMLWHNRGRFAVGDSAGDFRMRQLVIVQHDDKTLLLGEGYAGGLPRMFDLAASLADFALPDTLNTSASRTLGEAGNAISLASYSFMLGPMAQGGQAAIAVRPFGDRSVVNEHKMITDADGYRIVAGADVSGLRVFQAGGALVSAPADTGQAYLNGATELSIAEVGGQRILLTASAVEGGVTALLQTAPGTFAVTDQIGHTQGLGIVRPSALVTATVNGQSFAIVSDLSGSLSVLQIGSDGHLALVDHVLDTPASRLRQVDHLASFAFQGNTYIAAAGGEQGLSLLQILPGGRLMHLGAINTAADLDLDNISSLAVVATATGVQIFVGSETANGVAQIAADIPELMLRSQGTAGSDLLVVRGSNGHLDGQAGDDVLIDGAGRDQLTGGLGADRFILTADGQDDHITDFDPLEDRLDLSRWGQLYSASALGISYVGGLVTLTFKSEVLTLASTYPLASFDWDQILITDLQRPVVNLTGQSNLPRVSVTGDTSDDLFAGGDELEDFQGGAGRDTVSYLTATAGVVVDLQTIRPGTGFASGDRYYSIENVTGSRYSDWLRGDGASNILTAGDGDDLLFGGGGTDRLYGGAGADRLFSPWGNVLIDGGGGRDVGIGLGGALDVHEAISDPTLPQYQIDDRYLGGYGADTLRGGGGNDILIGDYASPFGSADVLIAGTGHDLIEGGAGADVFEFRPEEDTNIIARLPADVLTPQLVQQVVPLGADFRPGVDQIRLVGFAFANVAEVQASFYTNADGDAEFFRQDTKITLIGVNPADLSAQDFVLV